MKAEVKADNYKAFELGKAATVYKRTADIALNKAHKYDVKYNKTGKEEYKEKRNKNAKVAEAYIWKTGGYQIEAQKFQKELVKKYGKEHVSDIKYDDTGMINEKVHRGYEYIASAAATASSIGLSSLLDLPVAFIFHVPKSKQQLAREEYNFGYKEIADNPNYRQTLYKD